MAYDSTEIQDNLHRIIEGMVERASEIPIQGAAVAAYLDEDGRLVSQARACGKIFTADCNLLAIAYSKIAEMCSTLKRSGSSTRPPLHGEHGYAGGVLKQMGTGYYLASFSGAKGEEDVDAASWGLRGIMEPEGDG